jgi:GTPase
VLTPAPAPKLAAERDKEGHIEYKLKLIDPTPERFEKLVTQMMWRLKQGKNEAIYEIGLAGTSLDHHSVQAEADSDVL